MSNPPRSTSTDPDNLLQKEEREFKEDPDVHPDEDEKMSQVPEYEDPELAKELRPPTVVSDWSRGLGDDEYTPSTGERKRDEARQAEKEAQFAGVKTLKTRWTDRRVRKEEAQEIEKAFDDSGTLISLGIRNVRQRPEIFRSVNTGLPPIVEERRARNVTYVPGGYVNPNVQSWYYQNAFEVRPKKSWASEAYPELFGPTGIYPLAYEECDEECMVDGVCIC